MATPSKTVFCIAAIVIGTGLAISLRASFFAPTAQPTAASQSQRENPYAPDKESVKEGKACCEKPPSRSSLFNAVK